MSTPLFASRLFRAALVISMFSVLAPAGGAHAAAKKPAKPAPAPAPTNAADKAAGQFPDTPPDGKWLKDEEGREYFLDKMPKELAQRVDDKSVRTRYGIPLQVAKEDAKFYYFKVYRRPPAEAPNAQPKEPTPEDKEAVAAAYKSATGESDRLRFVSFGNGLPTAGQWRDGFDIADMNGDRQFDIVHSSPRKGMSNPVIFLGDGKGNWQRWKNTKYPSIAFDYGDAAVADFNKDGHLDIALGMHLRGMQVLLGDGKGNFTNWSEGLDFIVPGNKAGDVGGFSSKALAVTDWNGDGRPDLLALGEGPRLNISGGRGQGQLVPSEAYGLVVYLNQGNGKWVRKDQGTGSAQLFGDSLTLGDFNGDHRIDFATSSGVQGRKDLVDLAKADGGWEPVSLEVRPGSYVNAVQAGDFDHDGRSDLAVAYSSYEGGAWRSAIDVFLSRADGKWERRVLAAEDGRIGIFALGSGDLDGDGNADLVALTGDGRTWIFLGDGKGSFTREKTGIPAYPGGCRGYHVRLKDLDGDGKDEIVSSFAGEGSALVTEQGCPSGGGLTAWHLAPAAAKAAKPR
jgi:hypothetical protein